MLAQANAEIAALRMASGPPDQVELLTRAYSRLDWVITQLEIFHLAGKTRVPEAFKPHLLTTSELMPSPIQPPVAWNALIRRTIDQCFELQERIKEGIHRLEGD